MYPTYSNGEYIISTRIFKSSFIKRGDVVVFYKPFSDRTIIVIKRVKYRRITFDGKVFYFEGDNKDNSTDSRDYGWVESKDLISKITFPRKEYHA